MEETHRQSLETRMAIEEAWAELVQAAGGDEAERRVLAARQEAADFADRLRRQVEEDRRALAQTEGLLGRHRDDVAQEREAFTAWLDECEAAAAARAEDLRRRGAALDEHDAQWREHRDRWQAEKLEAEQVIRNLLDQLTRPDEPETPAMLSAA
jgi:hypothetical protein